MLSDWEKCREVRKTLAKAVPSFALIAAGLLAPIVVRAQSPPEQLPAASKKRDGADWDMEKEPVANTNSTLHPTDPPKVEGEAMNNGKRTLGSSANSKGVFG